MPPKTPWTEAADKQMLLSILHLTDAPTPKWEHVAALMGNLYGADATRQHYGKLKRDFAKQCAVLADTPTTPGSATKEKNKDDDDDDDDSENTKKKKSKAKNKKSPSSSSTTPKRKAAGRDDGDQQSPTKKVKAEVVSDEEGEDVADDLWY